MNENPLTQEETNLLESYADGPCIWDAASLLPAVTRLQELGLIEPVNADSIAFQLTEQGRALLNEA